MIQHIGPHAVTCASVDDPVVDSLLSGEKIKVLYSDPPWGTGNLRYWVTVNKRHTGRDFRPLTYAELQARFVSLIGRYVDGFAFVETGVKWEDELASALSAVLHNIKIERVKYRSGSKILESSVVYGGTSPSYVARVSLSGAIGLPMVVQAVKSVAVEGGLCCDPCCGMGYTARAAVAAGMRFRGNEFNEKRLSKTIAFLKKSAG